MPSNPAIATCRAWGPIMSRFRTLLAVAVLATLPLAEAAAESRILPKTSLMYQVSATSTPAEIKAICAEIIKRQDQSPVAMIDASQLYLHGQLMGNKCGKVDYYKAFTYARASGDAFHLKATLTFIRGRAAGGNPRAVSALAKIEKELR